MRKFVTTVILVFAAFEVLLVIINIPAWTDTNTKECVATVIGKEIKTYFVKAPKQCFMVHTNLQDGESRTFYIQDSILIGRYDSKDVYNEIQVGKTYKFVVSGLYEPALGLYENILEKIEVE